MTHRNELQIMEILKDRSPSSSLSPYIAVPSAINDRSCHPVTFHPLVILVMYIVSALLPEIKDRSGRLRFINFSELPVPCLLI